MKKRQTDADRRRIIRKGAWRMTVGGRRLNALKGDKAFQRLVALMRLANQIRFVNLAALQSDLDGSPPSRRQLNQSFFFTCALVFEGWALAQRLAQFYRDRQSFKDSLGTWLRDAEVRSFVTNSLKPLRNSAMFHPDEDEIGRCLAEVGNNVEVVESGVGTWAGATYYDLADNLLFLTLVGPCSSQEEFMKKYRAAMETSKKALGQYLHAADTLIADVLLESKPRFESFKLARTSEDEATAIKRAMRRMKRLP